VSYFLLRRQGASEKLPSLKARPTSCRQGKMLIFPWILSQNSLAFGRGYRENHPPDREGREGDAIIRPILLCLVKHEVFHEDFAAAINVQPHLNERGAGRGLHLEHVVGPIGGSGKEGS
jgi:hypothetical protein